MHAPLVLRSGERTGGYRLTREGRRLLESYAPLEAWAERWALRERRQASGVG